jgi:hypothetical protein
MPMGRHRRRRPKPQGRQELPRRRISAQADQRVSGEAVDRRSHRRRLPRLLAPRRTRRTGRRRITPCPMGRDLGSVLQDSGMGRRQRV